MAQLRIGERVVNDIEPKDRDIAMVFQNYALYPHMSVYDNIGFALKLAKVPEGRSRRADPERRRDPRAHREPRPQARSAVRRPAAAGGDGSCHRPSAPQAFLMDEPLSNLDAKLRVQMRAEIAKLQRDLGVTTIYVTHDQVEAMTMGDRVAVLKDGYLQQVDTPQKPLRPSGERLRRSVHRLTVDEPLPRHLHGERRRWFGQRSAVMSWRCPSR